MSVKPHIAIITLGVRDFARARRFYSEGLGWPIQQEQGEWVCFNLGDGSSALTLYPWDELADEVGMPADGSGFRGVTFAYNVRSEERVDEVLAEAETGGGRVHACEAQVMGRLQRLLHRSRRLPLGGCDRSDRIATL